MGYCIMVAVDVHDKSLVVEDALGREKPEKSQYTNDRAGRRRMLSRYRRRAKAARPATPRPGGRVVFAYEASSEGYGLYDHVTDAAGTSGPPAVPTCRGFECHVLAPSLMPRSQKHRRTETDRKDASAILEVLRGHILAGNKLPDVWIPDPRTRDDLRLGRPGDGAGRGYQSVHRRPLLCGRLRGLRASVVRSSVVV